MSEVRFSELKTIIDYRIESEYFVKKFLYIDHILSKVQTLSFTSIANFENGRPYCSDCFNCEHNGIPVSKIGDVTNKRPIENWEYITENEFLIQKGKLLSDGDILMTLTGDPPDVGKVNYVYNPEKSTWNQRVARIKVKTNQTIYISNYVLFVVLSSEIMRTQLERYAKGIRQRNLGNESLEKLQIPILPHFFQLQIEQMVKSAHAKLEESKQLDAAAEDQLLSELGLKDWQPKNQNINVKNLSESFLSSGRLDAEYYQTKYDEVANKLSYFKNIKINELVVYPVSSGATPKAGSDDYYTTKEKGIPFLRAVDINGSRVATDNFIYIKPKIHNEMLKRTKLQRNDVLFSIAGTVGRCGIFDYDFEANINQAIAILRFDEKIVKRLYVVLFFNSEIGKIVIEKYSRQGVQTNLNLEEVSNLSIPILPMSIQDEISTKVKKSFALKAESKRLLEEAKLMVEQEIEKGGE